MTFFAEKAILFRFDFSTKLVEFSADEQDLKGSRLFGQKCVIGST